MSCRCGISSAGQLQLTEEARIGLGLPLTLWFGDCSPADARLHQRLRQRIDFLAHFKRKGGRWLAVIGTAIGAGVDRNRGLVDHLGESVRERALSRTVALGSRNRTRRIRELRGYDLLSHHYVP